MLIPILHFHTESPSLINTTKQTSLWQIGLTWLLQLDKPVLNPTAQELDAEIEHHHRWNFWMNLGDGAFFWFGMSFISTSTIIPLFVSKLTDSTFAIALVAIIGQAGWFLFAIHLGFLTERLPMMALPLAALISLNYPTFALLLFFWLYIWFQLGAGMIAPAWSDLLARCFTVQRRANAFGTATLVGTGMGVLGATLSAWILETYPYPTNFVYTFSICTVATFLSWSIQKQLHEPVPAFVEKPPEQNHLLQRTKEILAKDRNFVLYLATRVLAGIGMMGAGFLTIAALQRWDIPDSTVGYFTSAMLLGQTVGNLIASRLADTKGHKPVLELGLGTSVVAFGLAWLAPTSQWYLLVFFLMGVELGIVIVSGTLVVLEFSEPEERPSYVGIANTITGVGNSIGPLLGGALALYSYDLLFGLGMFISLIAFVMTRWMIKDPRWV